MNAKKTLAGMAIALWAAIGCSQNFSDEQSGEALKAQGMQKVGGAPAKPAPKPPTQAVAGRESLGGINVAVPEGWRKVAPSSSMRVAEYHMSGARSQDEDATLAVFAGNMGTVEANVSRWFGQFSAPDGSQAKGRRWNKQVDGMQATLVDVTGTFAPGAMGRSSAPEAQRDYRMLGAIVDAGSKSFYFKLVGPGDTVGLWAPIFEEFIGGIKKD